MSRVRKIRPPELFDLAMRVRETMKGEARESWREENGAPQTFPSKDRKSKACGADRRGDF